LAIREHGTYVISLLIRIFIGERGFCDAEIKVFTIIPFEKDYKSSSSKWVGSQPVILPSKFLLKDWLSRDEKVLNSF
jgi:hypothetical protein